MVSADGASKHEPKGMEVSEENHGFSSEAFTGERV
jgi:hypothetical protein